MESNTAADANLWIALGSEYSSYRQTWERCFHRQWSKQPGHDDPGAIGHSVMEDHIQQFCSPNWGRISGFSVEGSGDGFARRLWIVLRRRYCTDRGWHPGL